MNYRTYSQTQAALVTLAAFALLTGAGFVTYLVARPSTDRIVLSLGAAAVPQSMVRTDTGYSYRRLSAPGRTQIVDASGQVLATMTDGARTVHLHGPERIFAEPRFTKAKVHTDLWVRLAPKEWYAGAEQDAWFTTWFGKARADRSPDVLGVAMEYTYVSSPKKDAQGRQYSGDAAFGPLSDSDPDGRAENSDFYDYLGISWTFPDKKEKPAAAHIRSLDCSGFLRMVYGYRLGYPLRGTNEAGPGLPRRAYAMASVGPGAQLMPNTGKRARDLDRLLPGDLLFFNAGPVQGANIEHSGMYLGVDDRGHHRFISSRTTANGPTMGDLGGESTLDGTGYWATRFRTARRI
ncbi:C40 family peptidase [Micromonospora inyonensis]|uniref:NlpC/P60 family protein n=1 Tax=Micromonospora inyonensis TaxID=47866 RepID=A0A1C6RGZ0_9ACTN|nr:NlpC/P60 family protein [Micromonospora inyonensis]SCL16406.1 NlpC/P60 family protein [Micromonospora inyonensis]